MEPEDSFPCSQQPEICPHHALDLSTSHQATLLLECIKNQKRVITRQTSRCKHQAMTKHVVV
jgi:hypothetical protein